MTIEKDYMERALALASGGLFYASPNPMVGAVIVGPDGRIIGEGFHRRCVEGHAEVNAVNSVRTEDLPLLEDSTIIDKKIPRVVVGAVDPFSKVSGRGIAMLRDAGCDVVTGVLDERSRELNARFFTAHTHGRPFVTLKWATDRDGMMDHVRTVGNPTPAVFSTAVTSTLVHRSRAVHDAILVGSGTWLADNPRLDVRKWPGRSPRRYVLSSSMPKTGLPDDVTLVSGNLDEVLKQMYADGVTSLLVEGGPTVLREFLEAGLWDLARVETAPGISVSNGSCKGPDMSGCTPIVEQTIDGNVIRYYSNNPLVTPLALTTF